MTWKPGAARDKEAPVLAALFDELDSVADAAIDARTTQHPGYTVSHRIRERVEGIDAEQAATPPRDRILPSDITCETARA
jgi:hypothetical protein